MEKELKENHPHGQVNPGQADETGKEVTISKREGISDQGNEWSDEEGIYDNSERILGEKAEKYIKDSANIEDLPDDDDVKNIRQTEESNKEQNSSVHDDKPEEDDVKERKEDFMPGYDLGRNKVQ